jgi:hypothetical protein
MMFISLIGRRGGGDYFRNILLPVNNFAGLVHCGMLALDQQLSEGSALAWRDGPLSDVQADFDQWTALK